MSCDHSICHAESVSVKHRIAIIPGWDSLVVVMRCETCPDSITVDTGDISEQKAIRTKLDCKPFKWFIEEVAFDLAKFYPPVEPTPYATGEVRLSFSLSGPTYRCHASYQ